MYEFHSIAGIRLEHFSLESFNLSWKHSKYSNEVDSPSFDARGKLAGITAPTLVIAGAKDLMPTSKVKETADGIENSAFVVFENSGHFAPFEEIDKFVFTVVTFLGIER